MFPRWLRLIVISLAVLVLLWGAAVFWFFRAAPARTGSCWVPHDAGILCPEGMVAVQLSTRAWNMLIVAMGKDANREQLHNAVDELPPSELQVALRYLRFLCYEASPEEPVDAETASELRAARDVRGKAISLEEARRRLGL